MTGTDATLGVLGAISGAAISIVVAIVVSWVRSNARGAEEQSDLKASLSALTVSVEYLGGDIRDLRKDTQERWRAVTSRIDKLPCREMCGPGAIARGGSNGNG